MHSDRGLGARMLRHTRRHAIAYVALCCSLLSLAGASYAAFEVPRGSVGASQLRNHSITPVKFSRAIGGSVSHWAAVNASGHVTAASSRARARVAGNTITVSWGDKIPARCVPLVTTQGFADSAVPSTESSLFHVSGTAPSTVVVTGSNAQGQPVAQPFYVAVIC